MAQHHDSDDDTTPTPTPPDDSPCYDVRGAGLFLKSSPETLNQWRLLGKGPAFYRIGRLIRYSLADLREYAAACRVGGAHLEKPTKRKGGAR